MDVKSQSFKGDDLKQEGPLESQKRTLYFNSNFCLTEFVETVLLFLASFV